MTLYSVASIFFIISTQVQMASAGEQERIAPAPHVAVAKVTEAEQVETRRYTGHVISAASVDLVARVAGEITEVGFQEGDFVQQGQVLYTLDPVRYEAEVRNVQARIEENRARLAYAEKSFNRSSELYTQKAASKDIMDNSESEYHAVRATLLAAEAQLVTAMDDLENARIVAPISGKIGLTNYTRGNYISLSSGSLATIIQTDPLRVGFSISSKEFLDMFRTEAELKKQAVISLRLANGTVYEHSGKVEFIDNKANHSTDTVQIYARFDNPEGVLLPDSTVTILLSSDKGERLPAVTPSAVMHDSKAAYVYVVDGQNKVERRDVVLGPISGRMQLIKSGIAAGETVIVDGMHKATSGTMVEKIFRG